MPQALELLRGAGGPPQSLASRPRDSVTSPNIHSVMQNLPVDAIKSVLTFACDRDHEAAFKRRFAVNHSWLEAHHGTPELWGDLQLDIRNSSGSQNQRFHCLYSAWARAPAAVRAAAERHTLRVILATPDGEPMGRYCLGAGLAGMEFQQLKMVLLSVYGRSTQSRDEDEAALAPLFESPGLYIAGGEGSNSRWAQDEGGLQRPLDDEYMDQLRLDAGDENFDPGRVTPDRWCGSLLDLRNISLLTRLFHKVQRLKLPLFEVELLPSGEDLDALCLDHSSRFLLPGNDEAAFKNAAVVDEETAGRLVELAGLEMGESGIMLPENVALLPNLKQLSVRESSFPLPEMASFLRNLSTACPSLEMLICNVDSEHETWWQPENYAVFALLPRTLVALVLLLDDVTLPQPATASAFVRLVKAHVPWCGVHVLTKPSETRSRGDGDDVLINLDDDGILPKPPWRGLYPDFASSKSEVETYSPEVLRRSTFQVW